MSVTIQTAITGADDLTAEEAIRVVLERAPAPLRVEDLRAYLRELHRLCARYRLVFRVLGGQAYHETGAFGQAGRWGDLNPAGLGITQAGDPTPYRIETGAEAARLHVWSMLVALRRWADADDCGVPLGAAGWRDRWTAKYRDPQCPQVRTIADLNQVYGPSRTRATWAVDPAYDSKLVDIINTLFPGYEAEEHKMGAKIILNMGHRDLTGGGTAGGSLTEKGTTDDIVIAARDALRRAGHTVFVNQELDGDVDNSFLNKSLTYVGRNAVEINRQHGPVQAYLSIHLEGSQARGVFGIVPDTAGLSPFDAGDTWAENPLDVQFARALAVRCAEKTGLPLRQTTQPGVMSERATGVGGDGWRLSEFHETYPMRAHATRNILECGALPNAADRAIIAAPGFPLKIADGIVAAVAEVFGAAPAPPVEPPTPVSTLPDDERLARLFGTVRTYNPKGAVSRAWREWCLAHGIYPALKRVYLARGGFTDYIFVNDLHIRWDPHRREAYELSKENVA